MERIERALTLTVEPGLNGGFLVSGGAEPHWVNLRDHSVPACDCGDYVWRGGVCAHIAAAMMREGATVKQVVEAMKRESTAERRAG
jgi:hypothetical protein